MKYEQDIRVTYKQPKFHFWFAIGISLINALVACMVLKDTSYFFPTTLFAITSIFTYGLFRPNVPDGKDLEDYFGK